MTDEEIVVAVRKGEREMFGELIDRYQKRLFGYIRGMINQEREEVEDLVGETFLRTYKNLEDFEAEKRFSSWIFRIAHNLAVDWMKKKRPVKIEDKEEDGESWWERRADKSGLIEEMMVKEEEKEWVAKAVTNLEVKYREVVWLYYYDNKSYEEISTVLRIPINNVGVILHRAKEKLKQELSIKN